MPRRTVDAAIRVGVQSADRMRREALAAYLATLPGFRIAGRVADPSDVVSLCTLERPDAMLLDAGPEATPAVQLCRTLRDRCVELRVVVMYERLTAQQLAELREAGIAALLPAAHGLGAVVATLDRLASGVSVPSPLHDGLSRRQREILFLLASGHSAIEIAELLHISPDTVANHKRRVYAKLNAASAVEAVARATAFGIISPPPATGPPPPNHGRTSIAQTRDPQHGETGRAILTIVTGELGPDLDRVIQTLIAHRLPVLYEQNPDVAAWSNRLWWHPGPVIRILVNPKPRHWRIAPVDRTTVVVQSRPVNRPGGMTAVLVDGADVVISAQHVEEHLVPVLRLTALGYVVMDGKASETLISTTRVHMAERPLLAPTLTARENDILQSIGRGLTVRQTARMLGIAAKTVENTQGHLFRKLGVHNRTEALTTAYSLGLLEPGIVRQSRTTNQLVAGSAG